MHTPQMARREQLCQKVYLKLMAAKSLSEPRLPTVSQRLGC